MISFRPEELAALLEARLRSGPDASAETPAGVSIDSRTVRPHECFFALRGPRFDGHEFIGEALGKGASWIVHESVFTPPRTEIREARFFEVSDTLAALQRMAARARQKWGGRLAAITGSMGKTTTRRFAAALLGVRYRVLESPGNLNNEYGVPLSLLRLEADHQVAVLELGMNRAGEIRQLAGLCAPDVAAVTNVAAVHLEFFSSVDEIAEAKGEILEGLAPGGHFVYNADDARVCRLAERHSGPVLSFALDGPADVRATAVRVDSPRRMRFVLELPDGRLEAQVPFAGRHFLYDVAGAAAIGLACGLAADDLQRGLGRLEADAMRGAVRELEREDGLLTVWDDSYNSNPEALRAVLETLGRIEGYRRKVLVLGEMLELGPDSARLHNEAGRKAAACGAGLLVAVGGQARELARGAVQAGMPPERVLWFEDSAQAADAVAVEAAGGDLVLCKGSRGVRVERVVERLLQREEQHQ